MRKRHFVATILLSVLVACLYGMVHDLFTIRISPEYFTVWRPKIIGSDNLVLVALAWGIYASWQGGLILGALLALVSFFGPWPRPPFRRIALAILVVAGATSLAAIVIGLRMKGVQIDLPRAIVGEGIWALPDELRWDFGRAYFIHQTSHSVGYAAGIGASAFMLFSRILDARAMHDWAEHFEGDSEQLGDHASDAPAAESLNGGDRDGDDPTVLA